MATFTDLVRKRRKSGGSIGQSLSYGLKERIKEKFDPRRIFKQDGLLTSLFPKLRSYKSGQLNPVSSTIDKEVPKLSGTTDSLLESIQLSSKISAKNSLVLPSMARDIFLVGKNIKELVKIFGGTPKDSWKEWRARQEARETAYESKYKKESKTPTKEKTADGTEQKKEDESDGLLTKIGSTIFKVIGSIFSTISALAAGITKAFGVIGGMLVKVLSSLGLDKIAKIGLTLLGTMTAVNGLSYLNQMFGGENNLTNILNSSDTNTIEKYSGNLTGSKLVDSVVAPYADTAATVSATGAAVAGAYGTKQALRMKTMAEKTTSAITDVRTQSVSQLANSKPKTYWGKFLAFVARKSPKLFGKIAVKLAQAAVLATIPFFGWIGAAIKFGLSFWTAWELFELWKEFNNLSDEQREIESNSPTKMSNNELVTNENLSQTSNSNLVTNNTPTPMAKQRTSSNAETSVFDPDRNDFGQKVPESGSLWSKTVGIAENLLYGSDRAMNNKIDMEQKTKNLGDKVIASSNGVRDAQRQDMQPLINISKVIDSKPMSKPSTPVTDVDVASVFDSDFLQLLGMDESKPMFTK